MKYLEKLCKKCNKTFLVDVREHNRGNGKYCSIQCSAKDRIRLKNIERTCVYCYNLFLAGSKEAKYCSRSCKLKNYRSKQITLKYHSKTLQNILGHLPCEICGWKEATRDLHHIIPISKGGKNTMQNVIVVCPNHHRMFHHNLVSEEAIQNAFKFRLSLHPEFFPEQDAQAGY